MERINESNNRIEDLRNLLEQSGIDTSSWGQGPTKTLNDLQEEIDAGETILVKSESGELVRKLSVLKITLCFEDKSGKKFILKEDKQVFKNGSERKRNFEHSVSEKIKWGEDLYESANRAIEEELGISGILDFNYSGEEKEEGKSPSYPGLNSEYVSHKFDCTITEDHFNPDGYKEEQGSKTTYFVWEEIQD